MFQKVSVKCQKDISKMSKNDPTNIIKMSEKY